MHPEAIATLSGGFFEQATQSHGGADRMKRPVVAAGVCQRHDQASPGQIGHPALIVVGYRIDRFPRKLEFLRPLGGRQTQLIEKVDRNQIRSEI